MSFTNGLLSTFVSLSLVNTALCYVQCGINQCYGYSAHCCSYSQDLCCYYYVYHFWWFWFIWVIIFTLIASCSVCCYRRRRRYYRTDYAVVSDAYRPPAYGTVVTSVAGPPSYPATQHQVASAPPAYQPEQKPPAYVP